jgi:hypothetical protein
LGTLATGTAVAALTAVTTAPGQQATAPALTAGATRAAGATRRADTTVAPVTTPTAGGITGIGVRRAPVATVATVGAHSAIAAVAAGTSLGVASRRGCITALTASAAVDARASIRPAPAITADRVIRISGVVAVLSRRRSRLRIVDAIGSGCAVPAGTTRAAVADQQSAVAATTSGRADPAVTTGPAVAEYACAAAVSTSLPGHHAITAATTTAEQQTTTATVFARPTVSAVTDQQPRIRVLSRAIADEHPDQRANRITRSRHRRSQFGRSRSRAEQPQTHQLIARNTPQRRVDGCQFDAWRRRSRGRGQPQAHARNG